MTEFQQLSAAYVRGYVIKNGGDLSRGLIDAPLEQLSDDQINKLIDYGNRMGLKMYRFKEKDDLPRVKMAMGFLKAVYPESLLDVGSGRGVFLFPFLIDFPYAEVTALDILPHRIDFLNTIRRGGIERLDALQENICTWNAPDSSFDVVTMLEVLEHIPEVEQAVANAVRLARRYVVVSVPSKPDNNPEHIHLLTKNKLAAMFTEAGAKKLNFNGVNGHLFMTAAKE
ncbi:MAG: class I SAM-dependent methyltransferase [Clostridia bacterium]|uniref:class I SAM-dependent methyltransferase n=1 Tax=Ruminococcus sp. TaxID=41978 RepID=UPI002873B290|nr:class I SAM-dependent methyltransferase [Ruminococcus sp.]MBQ3284546.1 class I SAM-dependent methyltransferase [Ruminococcus sp.]MBR0089929.1 class I SAM-dependent methyltransferase [Clostridia bacterium]